MAHVGRLENGNLRNEDSWPAPYLGEVWIWWGAGARERALDRISGDDRSSLLQRKSSMVVVFWGWKRIFAFAVLM